MKLYHMGMKLITMFIMDTNNLIIEYSQNPPNKWIIKNANIRYRESNRVCADVVEVGLFIEDDAMKGFSFDGYMSIIATACVSITGELLEWQKLSEILKLDESFVHENIGNNISPRRRNASLIGLLAIKNAIHEYLKDAKKEDFSDVMA